MLIMVVTARSQSLWVTSSLSNLREVNSTNISCAPITGAHFFFNVGEKFAYSRVILYLCIAVGLQIDCNGC